MNVYTSEKIRNVVLLGHGGCGKTTLVEAMAYATGVTKRQGKVDEGNTISDYDKEEIKRLFSISTSLVPIEWEDNKINILDTPGYFDFAGEVEEALSAVDGAVIVISGKAGVEVGSEKAWEYCEKYNIPRIVFVTDMDEDNASFSKVVGELKERYGKRIAPFHLPIRDNEQFAGFINVVKMAGRRFNKDGSYNECEIPQTSQSDLAPIREMILEAVAETSEDLMEKYFSGEEFTQEEISLSLRKNVIDGSIVPILCGSGINTYGVRMLLQAIEKYLPSSASEHIRRQGKNQLTSEEVELTYDNTKPVILHVFKTIVDPFIGRFSMFRVCQGTLKADTVLYNVNKDIDERIAKLYLLRGKEQIEVSELRAGDIGAVAKLSETSTGDTLCAKNCNIILPPINLPEALNVMAYAPKSKGDEDKVSTGLNKLMEEDLTLKIMNDKENRQTLIYGIGDQHLEVAISKLFNKYKVEVELFKSRVPYRETIKKKVRVQGKHKKQSGGHGQYGDVHMEFEPSGDLEKAYVFEEKIFGGAVPRNYFPAVEKGIQECVLKGPLAGYPVVGVKATLVDGSYHAVDSSEMAFKLATTIAFKKGILEATPILLEPIASVKVTVPDRYMGDVIGDLNKRRGRVLGMNPLGNKQVVEAEVPLAEMMGYSTDLRSMTGGRGDFTYKFERYEQAPSDVQAKVIEDNKSQEEDKE